MFDKVWDEGPMIREVRVDKPVLASWDRKDHPSQLRLNEYLGKLMPALTPLPDQDTPLFLHYEIGVDAIAKLVSGCDLENCLFPLFGRQRLPADRFVLVSARKQLGNSSSIRIGYPVSIDPPSEGWTIDFVRAGSGSTTKAWKERIRDGLAIRAKQLESGPVAVQIAYCCSSNRNWTGLWKPSGDAMGPILGTTRDIGFHPCDDRIAELKLHKLIDDSLRHDVRLGYWWRKC